MTRHGVERCAVKTKYSLENSMFEIQDTRHPVVTDFEFVSRKALIVWGAITALCVLFRVFW